MNGSPYLKDRRLEHVRSLGHQYKTKLLFERPIGTEGRANWFDKEIQADPYNQFIYATFLHEFGHFRQFESGMINPYTCDNNAKKMLTLETDAWDWAIQNAVDGFSEEELTFAGKCLGTYRQYHEASNWIDYGGSVCHRDDVLLPTKLYFDLTAKGNKLGY